jgi:uncharacterized protein (UPF0335 family)
MVKTDIENIKLARPVAVVDLWEIDDRIERLENCISDLKEIVQVLIKHGHDERVRDFERILNQALDREDVKKENKKQGKTFIKPIFETFAGELE